MAALSVANPRASDVRRNAQALRAENDRLRREARAHVGVTRRRLHVCLRTYARTAELSSSSRPSPWSALEWEPTLDELDQVLVAL